MADLAGVIGTRKDFKVVGKPNLPGRLSYSLATGVAKYGFKRFKVQGLRFRVFEP